MLTVAGLVSGYDGSAVLHGVDLTVPEGSVLALLGRNGSGKSTLINTVMGLLPAWSGSIRLDDRRLHGRRTDEIARCGVGLVPQGRRVFAPLTVEEHLRLAERAGRTRTGPRIWTRDRVLDLLPPLRARINGRGGELSGGEQQLLAIARALLAGPRLLLLDEPSEGLAPRMVATLADIIRELPAGGITVLLVEQDVGLAGSVADHVAVLAKGRVVAESAVGEWRSDPGRVDRLLGIG